MVEGPAFTLRLSHCLHQAKNMTGEGKDNATYFSRPQSPCPVAAIEGCVVWTRLGRTLWGLGHNVSRVVEGPGK